MTGIRFRQYRCGEESGVIESRTVCMTGRSECRLSSWYVLFWFEALAFLSDARLLFLSTRTHKGRQLHHELHRDEEKSRLMQISVERSGLEMGDIRLGLSSHPHIWRIGWRPVSCVGFFVDFAPN